MKHWKHLLAIVLLIATEYFSVFSEDLTIPQLLSGYLENDISLQKLSTKVKQSQVEDELSDISNEFSFSLETGTITVLTGDAPKITLSPSASFNVPDANNLTINLDSDISISGETSSFSNSSIGFNADIISNKKLLTQITKLKSERAVLEARRALQDGFVEAEKSFYNELLTLYQAAKELTSAKLQLYEDTIDFEEIKAAGYSSSSAKYNTANLTVLADTHDVEKYQRNLYSLAKVFLSKCGIVYEEYIDDTAILERLGSLIIPQVDAIDILSFAKESYAEIESALWNHNINEMTRNADYSVSLSAGAGYTKENTTTDSDTVDVSSSLSIASTGLKIGAGVSVPVFTDNTISPAIKLSFSFDPTAFKTARLNKQMSQLENQSEELAIQQAESSYETAVLSRQSALEDIQWNIQSTSEYLTLYTNIEETYKSYFASGIITESVYRQSVANKEKYQIESFMNKINVIIYNDETKLLFTRDQEL